MSKQSGLESLDAGFKFGISCSWDRAATLVADGTVSQMTAYDSWQSYDLHHETLGVLKVYLTVLSGGFVMTDSEFVAQHLASEDLEASISARADNVVLLPLVTAAHA